MLNQVRAQYDMQVESCLNAISRMAVQRHALQLVCFTGLMRQSICRSLTWHRQEKSISCCLHCAFDDGFRFVAEDVFDKSYKGQRRVSQPADP